MSVNVLQNGKIVKLAGAVESDVIDQAIELATKQAVATAAAYAETIVAQAGGFHVKMVDRLPLGSLDPEDEEAIMPNTLYCVPNLIALAQGEDLRDTYMNVNDTWIQVTNQVITRENLDPELDEWLDKIYSAIGENDDKELYSVTQRIYDEAADALYKTEEDGTKITIAEAIGDIEQFIDDMEALDDDYVKTEFSKTV